MEDRFSDACAAVRAVGGFNFFDPVEDFVEGYVSGSELGEEAGLISAELIYDFEVVFGGE
jgi:hypothetical protein